jgi:hypothetical protein
VPHPAARRLAEKPFRSQHDRPTRNSDRRVSLRDIFQSAYGSPWVEAAVEDLGCTQRTVMRWCCGEHPAPRSVISKLVDRMRRRLARLPAEKEAALRDELAKVSNALRVADELLAQK